ncbi:RNA-guided endonuclease InsQ/TnpB family protein [Leptospirillum ferriphilum]|uniref:RNA-guided endonuclease InsQ/TnpB family protein n=1 Tax=Leptospirillum ferriphilum TaxID=178606 RepID=UPI0006B1EE5B|nr:RNA-guided endonuclease TnpB family protein [Leptospirillum ferriphilum]
MRKTFKYRLYPTRKQETLLHQQLEEGRWLYNHFLEHRKNAWEWYGVSLSHYGQQNTLPDLKKERPSLDKVYSQTLQNVAVRVDLAFKAFFRRVKHGENPGYPRFKGKGQYSSITYPQWNSGCDLTGKGLRLSKIGTVPIVLHRPVEGKIKTCTVLWSSTGKWWVTFSCENVQALVLPDNPLPVGIDVGVKTFATLSDGTAIGNPKFLKRSAKRIAQAQRKLDLQKKGSSERARIKKVVAKVHERVAFKRTDFAHQESMKIVNSSGRIFVEDITVNEMNSHRCLNRSIRDVAWSQFFSFLSYKAESAGREFRKVNPAYTSQTCSSCGHRQKMPLSDRTYSCPCCGMEKDRDHNASLNILRLGLESRG